MSAVLSFPEISRKISYSRGVGVFDTKPKLLSSPDFSAFSDAILSDVGEAPPPDVLISKEMIKAFKRTARLPWFAAPMGGDGRRVAANAWPWPLLVFDIDEVKSDEGSTPQKLLLAFIEEVRGLTPCFGYSSISHTDDNPRCRIVLQMSRPISAPESKVLASALLDYLSEKLGVHVSGAVDKETKPPCILADASMQSGSHIAFTPVRGFKKIRLVETAAPLNVDEWLAKSAAVNSVNKIIISIDDVASEKTVTTKPETIKNIEEVKAAISAIPASCDRDTWLKVGFAIRSLNWDCGFDLFEKWSLSAPEKYNERDFQRVWDDSVPERVDGKSITVGTLFHLAKAHGYRKESNDSDCPALGTDDGVACRIANWFDGTVVYSRARFYVWTGAYWKPDDLKVASLVKEYARKFEKESHDAWIESRESSKPDATLKAAYALLNTAKQKAVTEALRVILQIDDNLLDTHNYKLACINGTIDLRTGALMEANPHDYITLCTGIEYDPNARANVWERFIADALGGDIESVKFFQRFCGYFLTGDVSEEKLLLTRGPGNSGKSTAINAIMSVMGSYATPASSALFCAAKHGRDPNAHTAGFNVLVGKRLAAVNEVKKGELWDDANLKALVSTEMMTFRAPNAKENFSVRPTWKMWVRGNNDPIINDQSSGFWRRVAPLAFNHPPDRVDHKLDEKLKQELAGILAWAVRGSISWQEIGLSQPKSVSEAADTMRSEQDVMAEWVECMIEAGGFTSRENLMDNYCRFNDSTNRPNPRVFCAMMRERKFEETKQSGVRGFKVTLKPEPFV